MRGRGGTIGFWLGLLAVTLLTTWGVLYGDYVALSLAVSAILMGASLWLTIGRCSRPEIPSSATIWLMLFLAMNFLGGLYLFWTHADAYFLVRSHAPNFRLLALLTLGPVGIAAGVVAATRWLRFQPAAEVRRFSSRRLTDSPQLALWIGIAFLLALAATLFYFQLRGGIPLAEVLSHFEAREHSTLQQLRREFTQAELGSRHAYAATFYQFYGMVMPWCALFFLLRALQTGRRALWVITGTMMALTSFSLLASLDRWPLMKFSLMILLVVSVVQRWSWRRWTIWGLVLFAVFSTLTLIRHPGRPSDVLELGSERVLLKQVMPVYFITQTVPGQMPYQMGAATWNDISLQRFGHKEGLRFSQWTFAELTRARAYQGYGTSPTVFFTLFYVDFGFPGVLLGGFLLGLVLQSVYVWFVRGEKSLHRLIFYGMLTEAFTTTVYGLLPGTLAQYVLPLVLMYGLMTLLHRQARELAPRNASLAVEQAAPPYFGGQVR